MLINVLKSTDFVNAAYRPVKNRHFSANIVLCAENVSENEKSGKAEYSYFVPALWHLLLSPPPIPIVYLPRFLSCTSFYRRLISLFFAPHLVRIFRRTPMDAPRRGRRPRRPAARSFHASGRDISRSGATSFCPRRQKDAKTPPKTHGLWNSFTPNVIRRKKAHRESLPLLSPLPLPRTARQCLTP